jgi:hypothetical protein
LPVKTGILNKSIFQKKDKEQIFSGMKVESLWHQMSKAIVLGLENTTSGSSVWWKQWSEKERRALVNKWVDVR